MGQVLYLIGESIRGLLQARLMTFVSILTIAVTLFCIGAAALVLLNVQRTLDDVSLRVCMVAYISDDIAADTARIAALRTSLAAKPQSARVELVDKTAAKERFEELYGRDMLEAIDGNPLPASFEVYLRPDRLGTADVESLRSALIKTPGIEGVDYSREFAEKLAQFRRFFLWCCAVGGPLLVLALFVIITNTIRLTIFARRDLITNMQYVGATSLFIKTPFILEGILQGLFGGLLALVALLSLRMVLGAQPLYLGSSDLYMAVILLGVGVGFLASMGAVRRFLT